MRLGRRTLLLGAAGALLGAAGCGAAGSGGTPVVLLYAASLQDLVEQDLAPGFHAATGYRLQGYPGGSQGLANEISGRLQRADVFISAAPSVDRGLMGAAHGNLVRWYVTFGASPIVLGYNSSSRFAAALRSGPWYRVLAEPGFRLGRTDPKLDPKGALTVQLVAAAAAYYHDPGLPAAILGGAENPKQVFPEQDLLGRLQAGQLDAGFFYSTEAEQAHLPTVPLPAAIEQQATFTVTVPAGAPHPAGARAFVTYLLGPAGRAVLQKGGVELLRPFAVSGTASAVPAPIAAVLRRAGS